jgi:hypothetical protein
MNKGILWVVLTEDSKKKLLSMVSPLYSTIYAHHVTLFHNISLTPEYELLLGKKKIITLKENVYNEKIQAVTVDLEDMVSQNRFPHITISAQKNVRPVESNEMLQTNNTSQPINYNMQIEGTIEFKEFAR